MFLFQRYLVVPVLHVKDAPNFEASLTLQDFLDAGKGVGIGFGGGIKGSKIHHEPIGTRQFFWYRKGRAAPRPNTRFDFTVPD